ncbi:nicotinate phosphoribosyltransferase [Candidatus Microgenomates bacterium]|nr:nicotinate phosphoribosyltransferase [Candidatus Microgenomates bacterium]
MKMRICPENIIDFYKADHRRQYPKKTTLVYSNSTPRSSARLENVDKVIAFGMQYVVKEYLINLWRTNFFDVPVKEVLRRYKRRMDNGLGLGAIPTFDHIEYLWNKQYLPLRIKMVAEGSRVNINSPLITIVNTDPKLFWLTNYLETFISQETWKMINNATTANIFRKNFDRYADETGAPKEFVPWQGHDFSARGMSGFHDSVSSGAAHLLSFYGTDSVHAIDFLEEYYGADSDKEIVGGSVPATEHSVMAAAGDINEFDTFKRLITEIYPKGIVSIVSDTWDYWGVFKNILLKLKDIIIKREKDNPGSKVVIRPDTGDPIKVINGDSSATDPLEKMGSIRGLGEIFGTSLTSKGYQQLNPCIGLIQGDSVNLVNQIQILQGMKNNGFASSNIVLGIGSYTYQYCTRDSLSQALKATYAEVDGVGREIFKNPKTGGYKKSHKGLLRVNDDGSVKQQCTWEEEATGRLETVFENGEMKRFQTLAEIRSLINECSY